MSGVYGSMLLSFPEQKRAFKYFDMDPQINSGYIPDPIQPTILGILQNDVSMVKDSNGNLVQIDHMFLWTEAKLDLGKFVSFDNTVYRITPGNNWSFEGSFYRYGISRLVGDNGTSTDTTVFNYGGTPV
jgi:hypothetical protein